MPIVRYKRDPDRPRRLRQDERERLAALSDEEIEAQAESDPDNPPLSDEALDRMVLARMIKRVRAKLALSQTAFAQRFHINVARLRDLEQGRSVKRPDSALMAYLHVIEREPEAVERALADW